MLEKLTPEEHSYLIGFLQGDGSHSKQTRNRGKIVIEIAKQDIDILDKIEGLLSKTVYVGRGGRQRNTNFKNNYESASLTVCNWSFRQEIAKDVPIGYKSMIIQPPNWVIPKHYIRGLVDAEGSIGFVKTGEPFCAIFILSESVKDFILASIQNVLEVRKTLNRNKRDNAYNIMLNNEDAINYARWLYKDASIYMDRKWNKANEIQTWVRTRARRPRGLKWSSDEDKIVLSSISMKRKLSKLNRTAAAISIRKWRLK
jgi:hypothetical protein